MEEQNDNNEFNYEEEITKIKIELSRKLRELNNLKEEKKNLNNNKKELGKIF